MNSKQILNSIQMGFLILALSACGKFDAKERPLSTRPTSTATEEIPQGDGDLEVLEKHQPKGAQPQPQTQSEQQPQAEPQTRTLPQQPQQGQTTPPAQQQPQAQTPVAPKEQQQPQAQTPVAPQAPSTSQVTPTPVPQQTAPAATAAPVAPVAPKTEPRVVVPELPPMPDELIVVKEHAPKAKTVATPTPAPTVKKSEPKVVVPDLPDMPEELAVNKEHAPKKAPTKQRVRPGMKPSVTPTPAPIPPSRPDDLDQKEKQAEKKEEKKPERPARPQSVPAQPRAEPKPQQTAEVKTGALDSSEIAERGEIKPTVYYFPVYDEEKGLCHPSEKQVLRDRKGKEIMKVCPKTLSDCGMQGSCAIVTDDETRSFNIHNRVAGVDRFFEIEDNGCRFGYGVKGYCLDPFYTLAADLSVYDPGDVIYIPEVVGVELPNGKKHNGLFIIRDRGRGIIGKGRFDFFTGFYGWKNTRNPFVKLRLADKNTRLTYYQLKGPRAEQFRQSRNFPKLPANAIDDMD